MRNYLQIIRAFFSDDANPPDPPIDVRMFFTDIDAFTAFTNTMPSSFTIEDGSPETWFLLLDKNIIVSALNNVPDMFNQMAVEQSSPRYGIDGQYREQKAPQGAWPSNDGNKNGPTFNVHLGSEKRFGTNFQGAPGLFTFLNSLPAYAEILRREGRTRDAGIVIDQYRQVIAGTETIQELLAIFRQNGL